jgi:hypothetical protein
MALHVPPGQQFRPIYRGEQKLVILIKPRLFGRASPDHLAVRPLKVDHRFKQFLKLSRTT